MWARVARGGFIAAAVAVAGCGSTSSNTDAGAGVDTGQVSDLGVDAGTAVDTGADTGTAVDAGTDTGTAVDTGTDSGTAIDAGADTGTAIDAGADTGTAVDAGADAGTDTGTIVDAGVDAGQRCDDAGCYSPVVSVGAGASNTCVALEDGRVLCLGTVRYGVLGAGAGDGGVASGPVAVAGLPPVAEVTLDGNFACARTAGGQVWCWGDNHTGQIGNGSLAGDAGAGVEAPTRVLTIDDARVVASGSGYTCAIRADATLWCWGANGANQLGRGTAPTPSGTPTQVAGLTGVTSVSVGGHTCAVAGGVVSCWGPNTVGQTTGVASSETVPMPAAVAGVGPARSVAVGRGFTCALLQSGEVWCWGDNTGGRLGRPSSASAPPGAVPGLTGAVSLAGGTDGMCAILTDGRVSCFGLQREGELGTGVPSGVIAPTVLTGLSGVVALTSAIFSDAPSLSNHRCALTGAAGARGRVFCWGPNALGQLADGTRTTAATPVAATLFP